jgi:MYXO-CTERM domain-containing protein
MVRAVWPWALVAVVEGVAAAAPRAVTDAGEIDAPDPVAAARQVLGGRPRALVAYRRSLAAEHVRFAPLAPDGTRVAGAQLSVHLAGAAPRYRVLLAWDDDETGGPLAGDRGSADAAARAAVAAAGGTARAPEPVALPDAGGLVAGWRVIVAAPGRELEVWVDGAGRARVVGDLVQRAKVYRPNPVVVTGDTALADADDADSPELTGALDTVDLPFLDGSGMLRGSYADVTSANDRVIDGVFDYTRSEPGFEEVNAYFHITRVQQVLQQLGYVGAKAILGRPLLVIVNAFAQDNSFYSPAEKIIRYGSGGVDDAEDGDVVAHEYGHALQDFIVPDYRGAADDDSGVLAEGFGDSQAVLLPTGGAVHFDRHCFAAWDARGVGLDCLRRTDTHRHNPEARSTSRYPDSEIWSGALADLVDNGIDPVEVYRLVVESTFYYNTRETLDQAAAALLMADATLAGGARADVIRRTLTWRGVISTLTAPAQPGPVQSSQPVSLAMGPLADDADGNMTFSFPGAHALRVHFATLDMQVSALCPKNECDAVYLYGADGNAYARLGGNHTGYDAPVVPGDTVTVRWISDASGTSTGFAVDRIDILAAPGPPDAGPGEATSGCGVAAGGGGLTWAALTLAFAAARRRRRRPRS